MRIFFNYIWGILRLGACFLMLHTPLLAQDKAQEERALGEYLSGECVTCHQLSGKMNGIPAIAGYPAEAIIQFMNEYQTKKRANIVMQTIAAKYTQADIKAIAAYFSTISPK